MRPDGNTSTRVPERHAGSKARQWLNLNLFRILGLRQLCDNPVTMLASGGLAGPEGIV